MGERNVWRETTWGREPNLRRTIHPSFVGILVCPRFPRSLVHRGLRFLLGRRKTHVVPLLRSPHCRGISSRILPVSNRGVWNLSPTRWPDPMATSDTDRFTCPEARSGRFKL
ncbi:hypothetical protein EVAR_96916_1 [Eumeta japonica]|uniref:Uncharacterized protein n=1 Tax=Eumeta variegata TaxID=151549 RepID=A0A4C1WFN3_EUMVA|nr:hypothetical protein EVAR_96916_1 [Eumeta japonica]